MIMKRTVLHVITIILATIGCDYAMSAQEVDMMLYNRDVDGIEIGTIMTKEQVVEYFGEPTEYEYCLSDDGDNEIYYYKDSYLHFKGNVLIGFCIRDAEFSTLTNHIQGGLRINDSLSKLDGFIYGVPKPYEDGYILFEDSDNPIYLLVEESIIVGIDYSDPL